MSLTRLHINHVRNLKQVKLQELAQVNVFFGRNGSGKTSVLEAVHLLGMARSFRGSSIKSLITHGQESCVAFGMASAPGLPGSGVSLGVQRSAAGEALIKVAGSPVRSLAKLVEYLPLQVINADSFELLTGAPGARRQYLDWGVFHVEHRFLEQWQRFQRCIKQRNKLLRHGKIRDEELAVWTRDLATSGAAIGEYRKAYFKQLVPRFTAIMSRLLPSVGDGLELRYHQGWDRQSTYENALESSVASDIEQGYTHVGPQRADVRVLTGGMLAADILSRGQQKLVVCGLKLAQGQLMSEQGKGSCTYLVDDLPSELDLEHSRLVCELLASMKAQVFITCVDEADIASVWPEDKSGLALFHVEQGTVKAVIGEATG
ncbi:MAG: DNA replication/repair protein RecF [Gammaproteobacteria bacterium]|nr:DNA replication/repair protein RecF [Gammaproteobacteria bacterium]